MDTNRVMSIEYWVMSNESSPESTQIRIVGKRLQNIICLPAALTLKGIALSLKVILPLIHCQLVLRADSSLGVIGERWQNIRSKFNFFVSPNIYFQEWTQY